MLLLIVAVGLISIALLQGGTPRKVGVGPDGLNVEFVPQAEVQQAQPELDDRLSALEARARAAAPAAPAAPTQTIDVSGVWLGDNGLEYSLAQFGTQVVVEERSDAYGTSAVASGSLMGSTVQLDFVAANGTTGTGALAVSGDTMTGTFTNRELGSSVSVTMRRTG